MKFTPSTAFSFLSMMTMAAFLSGVKAFTINVPMGAATRSNAMMINVNSLSGLNKNTIHGGGICMASDDVDSSTLIVGTSWADALAQVKGHLSDINAGSGNIHQAVYDAIELHDEWNTWHEVGISMKDASNPFTIRRVYANAIIAETDPSPPLNRSDASTELQPLLALLEFLFDEYSKLVTGPLIAD